MAKDSGEELVGNAPTLELANELRYNLARMGTRLWMLVMQNHEKTYDVFAASEWCGKLPDEQLAVLRNEAKQFIDSRVPQVSVQADDVLELTDEDIETSTEAKANLC